MRTHACFWLVAKKRQDLIIVWIGVNFWREVISSKFSHILFASGRQTIMYCEVLTLLETRALLTPFRGEWASFCVRLSVNYIAAYALEEVSATIATPITIAFRDTSSQAEMVSAVPFTSPNQIALGAQSPWIYTPSHQIYNLAHNTY